MALDYLCAVLYLVVGVVINSFPSQQRNTDIMAAFVLLAWPLYLIGIAVDCLFRVIYKEG